MEYGIGKIDLKDGKGGQYSELHVQVELIRRYGFAMLNIYIPSVTLLTISYVTLYFRPTIFEVCWWLCILLVVKRGNVLKLIWKNIIVDSSFRHHSLVFASFEYRWNVPPSPIFASSLLKLNLSSYSDTFYILATAIFQRHRDDTSGF